MLKWLEIILYERFGIHLKLIDRIDNIEMRLEGSPKKIIFRNLDPTFRKFGLANDLPLNYWDPSCDAMVGVIDNQLPMPSSLALPQSLYEVSEDTTYINYDILGLIFWILNRLEEIGDVPRDRHGRFKDENCHAVRNKYYLRPIVDEWLDLLGQIISRTWNDAQLSRHEFKLFLSHDVDLASKYDYINWRNFAKSYAIAVANGGFSLREFIRRNPRSSSELTVGDPFNTYDFLMDQSEKLGIKSAFYFICGGQSIYDATYKIDNPKIRTLLKHIHNRGHEIGLHASYKATDITGAIRGEFKLLRKVCDELGIKQNVWGGRTHYLRWKQPRTLQEIASAGLDYDCSLGYLRHVGFKCGTAFEYPAFDVVGGEIFSLRLRALHVMDLNVCDENAKSNFTKVAGYSKLVGGKLNVLIHNNRLRTQEKILFATKL